MSPPPTPRSHQKQIGCWIDAKKDEDLGTEDVHSAWLEHVAKMGYSSSAQAVEFATRLVMAIDPVLFAKARVQAVAMEVAVEDVLAGFIRAAIEGSKPENELDPKVIIRDSAQLTERLKKAFAKKVSAKKKPRTGRGK